MAHTELDIAYDDETLEEAVTSLIDTEPLTWAVVNESGPGGGWPIVRFDGPRDALSRMLGRYAQDPDWAKALGDDAITE